jgi:hypothetical protein
MNHDLVFIADSGRVRVWRRSNKRYLQGFMKTRVPFRGMVYADVCVGWRTDLYVCRRIMTGNMYSNDIVNNILP